MTGRLIVVARRPLPGSAKTRLAAAIGDEEAAGIYARMLYDFLLRLTRADLGGISLVLSVASPADVAFFAAAFPEFEVRPQSEGNLGQRLSAAFEEAFAAGARRVVLTASDVPDLDTDLIHAAFDALAEAPAVIGPAADGGYYLLGMRAPGLPLFSPVDWGTHRVLEQSEALARAAGVEMIHLPQRIDIDTTDDLTAWRRSNDRSS